MSHTSNTAEWDVIIAGSGPSGTAAAITLARSGARVLVLEKRTNLKVSLGESIPPASIGIVEHFLGPIDKMLANGVTKTSGNVSCWSSSAPEVSDFFFTAKGYGLCVDRQYFDDAMRQQALSTGAVLRLGVTIRSCERMTNKSWVIGAVHEGRECEYSAKFVLDCTGRRSAIASLIGIKRQFEDKLFAYAQYFTSSSLDDQDQYTRIEAIQDGWLYSNRLPVSNRIHKGNPRTTQRLVVFHTDKDSTLTKQASSTEGLMALLKQRSEHLTDYLERFDYKPTGRVRGAAAGSERLNTFCGEGWLAVGDAAQAYDPLSSQGIYKALCSGNMAGQMVSYSLKNASTSKLNKNHFFIKRYELEQTQLWENYVQQRNYYYTDQQRWPTHDFWSRRQQPTTHSMSNQ